MEALIARRQEALERRDAEAFSECYAPDATVESPTARGLVTRRKAIADITRVWFDGFPDVAFTTEEIVIDGDRVVVLVSTHGTDTGGFLGMPATGRPFRLPMVMFSTVQDGLIHHERRVYDFTGMLLQIGVLKMKPA
jgi:steroid delta-isomerase-like uncharacterized protein